MGMKERIDGWKNLLIGLGGAQDKTRQTAVDYYTILDDRQLRDLWMGDGFGKRIVSVVADDMTRSGFSIPEDTDGKIMNKLFALDWEYHFNLALKWSRLFGGALLVMGVDDGGKMEEPLNKNRIKNVEFLRVYSRDQIAIQETDLISDPADPRFGQPSHFDITPRNGTVFQVHYTRCIPFLGEPTPNNIDDGDYGWFWGMSYLQPIWDQLRNLGATNQGIANLMLELIVGKYKMKGLAQMIAEGNEEKVQTRMEIINAAKSLINAVLLDAEGEDYTRESAQVGGVADILDRLMMMLSGVSGIPVTRLFGRSPAGQNATGEADMRNYYDMVSAEQRTKLLRPLLYLTNLINTFIKVGAQITIEFNPLWEPTQKETVEMREAQSRTDKTYIEMGVLTGEEIRNSRFGEGYSYDTSIEEEGGEE